MSDLSPLEKKQAATPGKGQAVHTNWSAETAGGRDELLSDGDAQRLAAAVAGKGEGGELDERLARRGRRAAKLSARTQGREQRKNWRAREIAAEVFSLGLYRSVFDAKRARRKLGAALADEVGAQVELLGDAGTLVEHPYDGANPDQRASRRQALIDRVSRELIAQATADRPLADQEAQAAAADVVDAYLQAVSEAPKPDDALLGEQTPEYRQELSGHGTLDRKGRMAVTAALRSEMEGNTRIPASIMGAILEVADRSKVSAALTATTLVAISKLPPDEIAKLAAAVEQLEKPLRIQWALVVISEGHALADLEGTNQAAALVRITLAGEQLFELQGKPDAGKEAERLRRSGALGLGAPVLLGIPGVGDVPVRVHPAVTEAERDEWLGLIVEAVESFPPGVRPYLVGDAATKDFQGFSLYPGSSVDYADLEDTGVKGHHQGDVAAVGLGVNTRENRERALNALHHELVHRFSDMLVDDEAGKGSVVATSESLGQTTAIAQRLLKRRRAIPQQANNGTPAQKDAAAIDAGIISSYGAFGDAETAWQEDYVAESIAAYLDGGPSAATLSRIDPELYRTIGHVLWLADQGKLAEARQALVEVRQPASNAQIYPPPR